MKKFLLSILSLVAMTITGYATEATVTMADLGYANAADLTSIVVDESGYYSRRGLETLCGVRFAPGENDEISMTYAVDPYTYKKVKRAQTAQSSTSTRSTSSARSTSQSNNILSYTEQNEINEAKRRYERAVARASGYSGSKMLAEMNADEEKRAYAEYMRVLAKYAGRK